MIKSLTAIVLLFLVTSAIGQTSDSLFHENQSDRWSFRIHSRYRIQGISLRNLDNRELIRYTPINPIGIGVGLSYKYLVLDFSINLNTHSDDSPGRRYDFSGSYYRNRSAFDLFFQRYNSFELRERNTQLNRDDISTFLIGMNYYHVFSKSVLNFSKITQGGVVVKKSASSFSLGAYVSHYKMQADSSLVPPDLSDRFNDFASIQEVNFTNVGILAGYVRSVVLPKNFFTLFGFLPGIGINTGYVSANEQYDPGTLGAKLNVRMAVGHSDDKKYVILSGTLDNFFVDVGNENRYRYSSGRIKLVVGIRINRHIKPIEDILPE